MNSWYNLPVLLQWISGWLSSRAIKHITKFKSIKRFDGTVLISLLFVTLVDNQG